MRRVLVALAVAASAAAAYGLRNEFTPTILWRGTPEQIRLAARFAALADIRACHVRIGSAAMPGYVQRESEEVKSRLRNLPELPVPHRAFSPLKHRAAIYAQAYDEEVIPYFLDPVPPGPDMFVDFGTSPPRLNCPP
jgi:hypothetical protein